MKVAPLVPGPTAEITNIAELADHSDAQADSAKQSSDRLSAMSRGLKDLIARFISKNG